MADAGAGSRPTSARTRSGPLEGELRPLSSRDPTLRYLNKDVAHVSAALQQEGPSSRRSSAGSQRSSATGARSHREPGRTGSLPPIGAAAHLLGPRRPYTSGDDSHHHGPHAHGSWSVPPPDGDDGLGPLPGSSSFGSRSQTAPSKAQRGYASNWVAQMLNGEESEASEMGISLEDMVRLRESGMADESLEHLIRAPVDLISARREISSLKGHLERLQGEFNRAQRTLGETQRQLDHHVQHKWSDMADPSKNEAFQQWLEVAEGEFRERAEAQERLLQAAVERESLASMHLRASESDVETGKVHVHSLVAALKQSEEAFASELRLAREEHALEVVAEKEAQARLQMAVDKAETRHALDVVEQRALREHAAEAEARYADAIQARLAMEETLADREKLILRLQEEAADDRRAAEGARRRLKETEGELTKSLAEGSSESSKLAQLTQKYHGEVTKNERLAAKLKELESKLAATEEVSQKHKRLSQELEAELRKRDDTIRKLGADITELEKRLKFADDTIVKQDADLKKGIEQRTEINKQLRDAKVVVVKLERRVRELEAELEAARARIKRLENTVSVLESKLGNKENESSGLQRLVSDLNGQVYHLTEELKKAKDSNGQLTNNNKEYEDALAQLSRDLQATRHELANTLKFSDSIQNKVNNTESALTKVRKDAAEMEAALRKIIAEKEEKEKRMVDSQGSFSRELQDLGVGALADSLVTLNNPVFPAGEKKRFEVQLSPMREMQEALVRSARENEARPPPATREEEEEAIARNMQQNVDQSNTARMLVEFRQNVNMALAETLTELLANTTGKLKEATDKVSGLQKRLDKTLPELNSIITAAEHKAEDQAKVIRELMEKIRDLEETKFNLEQAKASLDSGGKQLRAELVELKVEFEQVASQNKQLTTDLSETKSAYDLYRAEANQLDQIRRKLTDEISTLSAEREKLSQQLEAQTKLATAAIAEAHKLRNSLEDVTKLAEMTAKELSARQAKAEYLATQYAERLMQYEAQEEASQYTKGEKDKMLKSFELEANKRAHEQEELSNRLAGALQDASTATAVLSQIEVESQRMLNTPGLTMTERMEMMKREFEARVAASEREGEVKLLQATVIMTSRLQRTRAEANKQVMSFKTEAEEAQKSLRREREMHFVTRDGAEKSRQQWVFQEKRYKDKITKLESMVKALRKRAAQETCRLMAARWMKRIRQNLAKRDKERLHEGQKMQKGLIRSRDSEVQELQHKLAFALDELETARRIAREVDTRHADDLERLVLQHSDDLAAIQLSRAQLEDYKTSTADERARFAGLVAELARASEAIAALEREQVALRNENLAAQRQFQGHVRRQEHEMEKLVAELKKERERRAKEVGHLALALGLRKRQAAALSARLEEAEWELKRLAGTKVAVESRMVQTSYCDLWVRTILDEDAAPARRAAWVAAATAPDALARLALPAPLPSSVAVSVGVGTGPGLSPASASVTIALPSSAAAAAAPGGPTRAMTAPAADAVKALSSSATQPGPDPSAVYFYPAKPHTAVSGGGRHILSPVGPFVNEPPAPPAAGARGATRGTARGSATKAAGPLGSTWASTGRPGVAWADGGSPGMELSPYGTGAAPAGRLLPLRNAEQLLRVVREIYTEKLKADVAAAREGVPVQRMAEFTYEFFANRFGLPEVTQAHLTQFAEALAHFSPLVPELRLFALSAGIVRDDSRGAQRRGDGAAEPAELDGPAAVRRDAEAVARLEAEAGGVAMLTDSNLLGINRWNMGHALSRGLAEIMRVMKPPVPPLDRLRHPLAQEATAVIAQEPGISWLIEYAHTPDFAAAAAKVDLGLPLNEQQLPQVHVMLRMAGEVLHIEDRKLPSLFVKKNADARVSGWATRHRPPAIVVSTGALELLRPAELQGVIAGALAQLAGLNAGAGKAFAMAAAAAWLAPELLPAAAEAAGMRKQWSSHIAPGVERWERFNALSADRAALLASQQLPVVASAIMKVSVGSVLLAGQMSVDAFLAQAKQIDLALEPQLRGVMAHSDPATMQAAMPSLAVLRARELQRWAGSHEYEALVAPAADMGID